ncbi:MAG TPA: hypothetical protein VGE29_21440 [Prosthecobacter sp.]
MKTGALRACQICVRRGSLLLEASVALGLVTALALLLMRGSLLAITGNQWAVMQTLTDACLSREAALAARLPFEDISADTSLWPVSAGTDSIAPQPVELGKMAGGRPVAGSLRRFRTAEPVTTADTGLAVWRLHSVLTYKIGEDDYVKTRSILRTR